MPHILVVLFVSLLVFSAHGAGTSKSAPAHECGGGDVGGVAYRWCVDRPKSLPSGEVLYYLHGGGGSETSWLREGDHIEIRRRWTEKSIRQPTVISVSFGPRWLLSQGTRGKTQLYDLFIQQLMPELETKAFGRHRPKRRLLLGESMGGFNSIQLLKNAEIFSRVAIICPGILPIGPHSKPEEIQSFLDRNRPFINRTFVMDVLEWSRREFPTQVDWNLHDPLLIVKGLSVKSPEIYISCGRLDEYGFFEGAERFASIAKSSGASVTWQPLAGGHCVTNSTAVADFLATGRVD